MTSKNLRFPKEALKYFQKIVTYGQHNQQSDFLGGQEEHIRDDRHRKGNERWIVFLPIAKSLIVTFSERLH